MNLYEWYIYIPALIICCILGSLTLNNRRIFLSIFTAYIGASALAQAAFQITSGVQMPILTFADPEAVTAYSSTVYLIALAVLFVAGLVVQLAVTSKKKSKTAN